MAKIWRTISILSLSHLVCAPIVTFAANSLYLLVRGEFVPDQLFLTLWLFTNLLFFVNALPGMLVASWLIYRKQWTSWRVIFFVTLTGDSVIQLFFVAKKYIAEVIFKVPPPKVYFGPDQYTLAHVLLITLATSTVSWYLFKRNERSPRTEN